MTNPHTVLNLNELEIAFDKLPLLVDKVQMNGFFY